MSDELQVVEFDDEKMPRDITGMGASDESELLSDINARLNRIEANVANLTTGVNTIGEMMNSVADMFQDMMNKMNNGGIGAILGNLMGGKNNG